jgi:hypothetical protein
MKLKEFSEIVSKLARAFPDYEAVGLETDEKTALSLLVVPENMKVVIQ